AAELLAVLALEQRLDPGVERQLDGLACRPGGGDDDDPAARMGCPSVGVQVRRQCVVAKRFHHRKVHPADRASPAAVGLYCRSSPSTGAPSAMQGKVCLITGANRGIGREIAIQLARQGATVLAHARTPERAAQTDADRRAVSGNNAIRVFHADFAVQAEVRRLADEVQAATDRLHVLVNNAGAFHLYRTTTVDGHEATLAVNHLAPFILTRALKQLLRDSAPARVINISS